jgi:hypothetical protein
MNIYENYKKKIQNQQVSLPIVLPVVDYYFK